MKHKPLGIILLLSGVLCLSSCAGQQAIPPAASSMAAAAQEQGEPVTASREVFAMDTIMTIQATGVNAQEAVDAAVEEIQRLDTLLSVGNPASEVYAINQHGSGILSEDTLLLTQRSLELYNSTNGAYDMTVYPLMQLWGFTGDTPALPNDKDIHTVLSHCGSNKLQLEGNTLTLAAEQGIDFGGIAKGYTSGRIMQIFEEKGMVSGVVSLGGNVHCFRTKPDNSLWRCGITHPDYPEDTSHLLGVLAVQDKAVITSGGYERFFTDDSGTAYHHIMDMNTGYPAHNGLVSVTIVSMDGTLADGLSTACYVMGETQAIAYWRAHQDSFDMILMTEDGRLLVTEPIADQFESSLPCVIVNREP